MLALEVGCRRGGDDGAVISGLVVLEDMVRAGDRVEQPMLQIGYMCKRQGSALT